VVLMALCLVGFAGKSGAASFEDKVWCVVDKFECTADKTGDKLDAYRDKVEGMFTKGGNPCDQVEKIYLKAETVGMKANASVHKGFEAANAKLDKLAASLTKEGAVGDKGALGVIDAARQALNSIYSSFYSRMGQFWQGVDGTIRHYCP
jgi:hypothetical protein